jgi:hypothetical protein
LDIGNRGTCESDRPLVIGYRVVEVGRGGVEVGRGGVEVGRGHSPRTASFVSVFTAFNGVWPSF